MVSRVDSEHFFPVPGNLAALPKKENEESQHDLELIDNDKQSHPWCKLFCEKDSPGNDNNQPYYFTNLTTGESSWEEPEEEFWLWDYSTGQVHVSGLQKPTDKAQLKKEQYIRDEENAPLQYDESTVPDKLNGWQGYNPRIHGSYDPKAPYAAYHSYMDWKKQNENSSTAPAEADAKSYESTAAFNAHTGRFQSGDQSVDRHNDYNKSGRQMGAFFDVDAAANAHQGKSLKAERQATKYSKKEVAAMNEKRKAKKQEKRMAFLKS